MLKVRSFAFVWILSVAMMGATAGVVSGQDYPTKPIHLLTGGAGSGNDVVGRLMGPVMSLSIGQPIVIENRGGGSATSGVLVAKAAADGYTLIGASNSFWTASLLQNVAYDVARDFAPVSLLARSPLILIVHPSLPSKTTKELIAFVKARPGELNYSTSGTGGSSHLAMELLKSMAGINITRVSYANDAGIITAMLGGEVPITVQAASLATPLIKSGKVRALAVTTLQPTALVPGVPTVAASAGLPGYEADVLYAMFAPAKTPAAVVARLNQESVRSINHPEVKEKLFNVSIEAVGSSPEELATTVKAEISRMSKVIKDAGIKAD